MDEQLPFHQLTHQQQRSLDLIEEVASPDLRLCTLNMIRAKLVLVATFFSSTCQKLDL